MRTRTLLLLAVTCGLLILVAGGIFFLQLSLQDPKSPPLNVGDSGTAGDVTVTVESVEETDGRMTVTLEIGGIDDDDALDGFTLVGVPNPVKADSEAGTCDAIRVAPVLSLIHI